jgi:hypothetical protein
MQMMAGQLETCTALTDWIAFFSAFGSAVGCETAQGLLRHAWHAGENPATAALDGAPRTAVPLAEYELPSDAADAEDGFEGSSNLRHLADAS